MLQSFLKVEFAQVYLQLTGVALLMSLRKGYGIQLETMSFKYTEICKNMIYLLTNTVFRLKSNASIEKGNLR